MEQASRIVIVGGGIAGLELTTKLGDRLGRAGRAEVTLVGRSPAHAWKPILCRRYPLHGRALLDVLRHQRQR